jgi:hypothetical protein
MKRRDKTMTQDEYDMQTEFFTEDFDPVVPMLDDPPFDPDEEYPFEDGEELPSYEYAEYDQ